MGKIIDAIFGRSVDKANAPTRPKADGSTLGLSTPKTIRGNTVFGPSGGRATGYATKTPYGGYKNVGQITERDYAAAPRQESRGAVRGLFSSSNDKAAAASSSANNNQSRGGGNQRGGPGGPSGSRNTGGGRGMTGPSGMGASGRGTGSKKKAGGLVEGEKWIKSAIKKPGALRSALGVKSGSTISAKKLSAAAKKPGKIGQRARLAKTLKSLNKGK